MISERRASGLIVLAACGYGTLSIATTLGHRAGVALIALMAWRYLLAAPILVVAAGGVGALRVPLGRALALLAVGGGGQTLVTWLSLSSLEWLNAAQLGFLFYTYPAWVALLGAATGSERLTATRVVALVIALGGIVLMVGMPWDSALPLPGLLRALGSAIIYAAYIPLLHRMRGPLSPAAASSFVIAGAATVFVSWAWLTGVLVAGMTPAFWALAALIAVFSTAVAFIVFLRGLEVLGPVRTAILSTVEPFYTAILAALVLGQTIGSTTLAGGVCIIIAILLLQRSASPPIPDAPLPD